MKTVAGNPCSVIFVGLLKNYVAESENMCYNNKMQNLHTVQMAAIHFFQRRKDDFRCNFNSQMMSQNYSLLRFGKF